MPLPCRALFAQAVLARPPSEDGPLRALGSSVRCSRLRDGKYLCDPCNGTYRELRTARKGARLRLLDDSAAREDLLGWFNADNASLAAIGVFESATVLRITRKQTPVPYLEHFLVALGGGRTVCKRGGGDTGGGGGGGKGGGGNGRTREGKPQPEALMNRDYR
eukprot:c35812_g1_i1.p2 GENE.c35812_g1_i1~~c35812_g1_i1.p2  ORF type:complete len:163 (+),score=14.51 c35812_g1_i1:313-801(+)